MEKREGRCSMHRCDGNILQDPTENRSIWKTTEESSFMLYIKIKVQLLHVLWKNYFIKHLKQVLQPIAGRNERTNLFCSAHKGNGRHIHLVFTFCTSFCWCTSFVWFHWILLEGNYKIPFLVMEIRMNVIYYCDTSIACCSVSRRHSFALYGP